MSDHKFRTEGSDSYPRRMVAMCSCGWSGPVIEGQSACDFAEAESACDFAEAEEYWLYHVERIRRAETLEKRRREQCAEILRKHVGGKVRKL